MLFGGLIPKEAAVRGSKRRDERRLSGPQQLNNCFVRKNSQHNVSRHTCLHFQCGAYTQRMFSISQSKPVLAKQIENDSKVTAKETPQGAPVQKTWAAKAQTKQRETPLDRWQRLHAPVTDRIPVKSKVVSAEAQKLAASISEGSKQKCSAREAQEMIDTMTSAGISQPMWPNFKSMGFSENQAGAIHTQLKSSDEIDRRTSLGNLSQHADYASKTKGLVTAAKDILAGATPSLKGLTSAQATVIQNAARLGTGEQAKAVLSLLEFQLQAFITDSPTDLLDGDVATTKSGLETAIALQTHVLKSADKFDALKAQNDGFNSFSLLRELTVIDPVAAQKVGSAFANSIKEAQQRTRVDLIR
jgi:hypothetical protein